MSMDERFTDLSHVVRGDFDMEEDVYYDRFDRVIFFENRDVGEIELRGE